MTGYPQLASDETAWLLEQCCCALDEVSPELGEPGGRLLAGLTPRQWPVEWHLPWWLAAGFGLPEAVWRVLTICNVLGLGYVHLQDRLAESGGSGPLAPAEAVLASALHEAALARLAELFAATPAFWQSRRMFMAQWLRSLLQGDRATQRPFAAWQEADLQRLAWRGAPLQITAVGACLLAERTDQAPVLVETLNHMLLAQVLQDHVDDWREDLADGRYNAFVAYASGLAQDAHHVDANRRRVLAQLMLGDPSPYFQLVELHAERARQLAFQVGCQGLAAYLLHFESEARLGSAALIDAARGQLTSAVDRILAPQPGQSRFQPGVTNTGGYHGRKRP